jgi:hypothetical protein
MGVNSLTLIGTSTPVNATGDVVDQYYNALSGDLVPRTSGVPAARAGSVGTPTFPFGGANINSISYLSESVISSHFQFKNQTMTGVSSMNTTLTAYSGCSLVMEGVSIKGGLVQDAKSLILSTPGLVIRSGYWAISDFPNDAWTTIATIPQGGYFTGQISISTTYSGDYSGCKLYNIALNNNTGGITGTITEIFSYGNYAPYIGLNISSNTIQGYRNVYGPISIVMIGAGGYISYSNGM